MKRSSGVLFHITSLPSPYGIGTLGQEARDFADFLKAAGQSYWQILPICPTGFGDSPYQSFASNAGNPYMIDLPTLIDQGLLTKEECQSYPWGDDIRHVDFGTMYLSRYALLKLAHQRFLADEPEDFASFCEEESEWLSDYALFMALKDAHQGASWDLWEEDLRYRKPEALAQARAIHQTRIHFYQMLQYLFYRQWKSFKAYVNDLGIGIIGDIPIYVSLDSSDVWCAPEQFYLDKNLKPIDVAGCPPDAFAADGQLWGNPLFRWDVMKADDYTWWTRRVRAMSRLYDLVRIDHFRAFDSYFAIPAGDSTAHRGVWRQGPGIDLFRTLEKRLGKLNIIVEDLGYLTDSVIKLVQDSGFPGMKLIQFAFDTREAGNYMPHHYQHNIVVYTGTHDNDTIMGWMKTAPEESIQLARKYLNLTEEEGYNWGFLRCAWSSVGDLAIATAQDLMGLGSEARMNQPSTMGKNWTWRATREELDALDAEKILDYMKIYERI